MNTRTSFWSRPRNRVIAACTAVGIAGATVLGVGAAAQAAAPTPASAAVVSAAAVSPTPTSDAARLRAALRAIRSLPVAQRHAALEKLKKDVLDGVYGVAAQRELRALDAVVASDSAGLRGALLRLAAVHPHESKHPASSGSTPVPTPSSSPAVLLAP